MLRHMAIMGTKGYNNVSFSNITFEMSCLHKQIHTEASKEQNSAGAGGRRWTCSKWWYGKLQMGSGAQKGNNMFCDNSFIIILLILKGSQELGTKNKIKHRLKLLIQPFVEP